MLVLTRKIGERIMIGDNIVVTVLKLPGNRVKLGITGPPEIPIHREELSRSFDEQKSTESGGTTRSIIAPPAPLIPVECGQF